jgi:PleD family two-component response regulator
MGSSAKTVILVADDEDAMVLMLRDALRGADYEVVVAHNGEEAIDKLRENPPDLVLLDVKMPKMSGVDVCRQIKSDVFLRHIPVMLLTAQAGTSHKVAGLEQGADDYLTKPFDLSELIARIRTLLRRTRLGLEANPLTRLPGNVTIETEILARIQNKTAFAVLYVDLNSFKAYNDTYGFVKGDDVIRETARLLLTQSALTQGFVGHIGGDDFVVLSSPEHAEALSQTIIKAFDAKVPGFYTPEDQARGYVESKDRKGVAARFPLLSMAIGVVTNQHRPIESLGEVSKIGAEMKHFAKENKDKGSAYAIDRRRE